MTPASAPGEAPLPPWRQVRGEPGGGVSPPPGERPSAEAYTEPGAAAAGASPDKQGCSVLPVHNSAQAISLLYSISPWQLALRRLPALAVTLVLELLGGLVIAQLHKVPRPLYRAFR